jgi:hypothetical protein
VEPRPLKPSAVAWGPEQVVTRSSCRLVHLQHGRERGGFKLLVCDLKVLWSVDLQKRRRWMCATCVRVCFKPRSCIGHSDAAALAHRFKFSS